MLSRNQQANRDASEMTQEAQRYERIANKAVRLGKDIKEAKGLHSLPTFLVGLAGEYLIMQKLTEKGLKVHPKGGQGGYDLELSGGTKIEVRTSLLKDEGVFTKEKKIRNYGWRLKDRNKDINFDFILCVELDQGNISASKCYVLTAKEVERAPPITVPRFKKVEKRLWIYRDLQTMKKAKRDKPEYVPPWEENINQNKNQYEFENRWKMLLQTP